MKSYVYVTSVLCMEQDNILDIVFTETHFFAIKKKICGGIKEFPN